MSNQPTFVKASPYQKDVLALPVTDINAASKWYSNHFGMKEVERTENPIPTVILERDGVKIGFAVNGGDAAQDGAAINVTHVEKVQEEIRATGAEVGETRIDKRDDGSSWQVFFVVAPDGLCYYFHECIDEKK
eukprot:m.9373 g.9373  ORF g.9373 m.9373 type:complete len:133 (+) comp4056_c0_seq1:106-504(+)